MKKINLIKMLTIAVVALTICACGQQTVAVKSLSYTNRYYIMASDTTKGALNVSFQVELPESYATQNVFRIIRSTLINKLFGEKYVNVADDSVSARFFDELVNEYRLYNEPELLKDNNFAVNYEYNIEGFTGLNNAGIYAYGITKYIYTGGANGVNEFLYYNFDLKDGHLISEKDLFIEDTENQLITLLKQEIVENSETMKTLKDLEQSNYDTEAIKPNGNFFISDNGITYVFNPLEIGPHYLGSTDVFLSYNKLAPLLKATNPVACLVATYKAEEE